MKIKADANPDGLPIAQEMLRFEFIEFLTRLAKLKYVDSGHY